MRGEREKVKIIKQTFWECEVNKETVVKKNVDLWEKIIPFIPEDYFFRSKFIVVLITYVAISVRIEQSK
jgi:hypothetical protein